VGDGTLNPFFGGVANNNFLQPGRVGTGNLDAIVNFGSGATINSGMTLDANFGFGGSSTQWQMGPRNSFPARKDNSASSSMVPTIGWMRVIFTNSTSGAVVKD
jgi:hypothetical protein